MIHEVIEKWHLHMKGQLPGGLDELLDDDVVFISPIVFTPQEGKAITKLYLQAAGQTLPGEKQSSGSPTNDDKSFRYIKEVLSGSTAVLEFETYGIDMITCNDEGKITEFKVMIRPLQAINLVHKQMGEMLERMKP